jgi:agmatine deiminase
MRNFPRQPAEWAPHESVWVGWPSADELWAEDLDAAREEVGEFVRTILFPDPEDPFGLMTVGETVDLVYRGAAAKIAAESFRTTLSDPARLRLVEAPIGDVWLRDTGPVFTNEAQGSLGASAFRFNGWGDKYRLPEDDRIADLIAEKSGVPLRRFDIVAEGGALETDGEGTFVTTRQCLLNANRNPGKTEADIDRVLREALGAEKVIWLDDGLIGDHTDGHVDNLARFVAPGKIVCMRPSGKNDPNAAVFDAIRRALSKATDAGGRKLDVIEIPSPGRTLVDGEPVPASHMNFYIANEALIMPSYGGLTGRDDEAEAALEVLEAHVDRPHFFAIDSSALLSGGGSFHCISQQTPKLG